MAALGPQTTIAKQSLTHSSLLTMVVLGIRLVTQACSLVLMARLLGPALYGQVVAAVSLALVTGIVPNLGAGWVLMSRMAHESERAPADVWSYTWPLHLGVGLALLAAYLLAAPTITAAHLPPLVWLLLGATDILITPSTMHLSSTLQATERVPLGQLAQWIPLGLRLLVIAPCFMLPKSTMLLGYASLQSIAAITGLLCAWRITSRRVSLRSPPRLPRASEIKTGSAYAALSLISANLGELDKIIAVHAVGAYQAGIYATTSRLISAGTAPVVAILMSVQPRLFTLARRDRGELQRLIVRIALSAAVIGLCAALMILLVTPLLTAMFGTAYRAIPHLLHFMAWIVPIMGLRLAAVNIMIAMGHPSRRIVFDLFGACSLVVLMIFLGHRYGASGLGMALLGNELLLAVLGWLIVGRSVHVIRLETAKATRKTIDPPSEHHPE